MIRIAILGTGGMANHHARAFGKIKGCKVVAACDVDEKRAKAFASEHRIPHVFANIDDLLEECEFEGLSNVTPDPFHAPTSIKAIKAGKHVLCEKPLALDHSEALQMVRAAKKYGIINMVQFSYRRAPAIQKARQLILDGYLGSIVHLDGRYLQSWLTSPDWPKYPSLLWRLSSSHGSRGVLGDLGVHILDFASYPVGKIKKVNARLGTHAEIKGKKIDSYTLDANDTALMNIEFENGALGSISVTRWAAGHGDSVQLRIFGTRGALRIDLDHSSDKMEVFFGKDILKAKWREIRCPATPNNFQRFINSIRTGINEQPDFERGAEIQAVLDACFVSDAKGNTVTI